MATIFQSVRSEEGQVGAHDAEKTREHAEAPCESLQHLHLKVDLVPASFRNGVDHLLGRGCCTPGHVCLDGGCGLFVDVDHVDGDVGSRRDVWLG